VDQGSRPRRDPRPEVVVDRRPWGWFERLTQDEASTVKILTVEPGHRLSLQRHACRDELWTIIEPGLVVDIAGERRQVVPGDRLWIPRGTPHRVGNVAKVPGRLLEVAFGRFDEDDIERLADDYRRG